MAAGRAGLHGPSAPWRAEGDTTWGREPAATPHRLTEGTSAWVCTLRRHCATHSPVQVHTYTHPHTHTSVISSLGLWLGHQSITGSLLIFFSLSEGTHAWLMCNWGHRHTHTVQTQAHTHTPHTHTHTHIYADTHWTGREMCCHPHF